MLTSYGLGNWSNNCRHFSPSSTPGRRGGVRKGSSHSDSSLGKPGVAGICIWGPTSARSLGGRLVGAGTVTMIGGLVTSSGRGLPIGERLGLPPSLGWRGGIMGDRVGLSPGVCRRGPSAPLSSARLCPRPFCTAPCKRPNGAFVKERRRVKLI
jgi:hypothetical protein